MPARLHEGDEDAGCERLLEVARDVTVGELSDAANAVNRARFLGGLRRAERRSNGALAMGGVGILAAGATLAPLRGGTAAPTDASTDNGYVSARGDEAPAVRFAGDARVDFAAGSRGRVGAAVVLEGGQASIRKEGEPSEAVVVEAGPYELRSGNGVFDVSWSGTVFQVRVASGAVELEGPAASKGLTLHEEQSFVACEGNGETRCF